MFYSMLGDVTGGGTIDVSALTSALSVSAFGTILEDLLPIAGVACLVGFMLYVVRWAIGLFRGI